MRRLVLGSCCVVGLGVGCADSSDKDWLGGAWTGVDVGVSRIDADAPVMDYSFGLRIIGPAGDYISGVDGLRASDYGNGKGSISYVAACQPGRTRVGVAVGDVIAGVGIESKDGLPIEGLVQPGRLSITTNCVENQDTTVVVDAQLATLRDDAAGDAVVAFSDITCTTTQLCSEAGVSVDVACTRSAAAESALSLGVTDTRVVCGTASRPIEAHGVTGAFETSFTGTASADGATRRWSMVAGATATDLSECRLQASVIAAPDLLGGFGPACMGWPVLALDLPLAPEACTDARVVEVGYLHGVAFDSELVVDARGPFKPTATSGWTPNCGSSPDVWAGPAAIEPGNGSGGPIGFLDIALTVFLPE